MSLADGFCLDEPTRKRLHERIGRELPSEVWEHSPVGHRLLIVPEVVSERTQGMLYKPRTAIDREALEMGAGWVVAVGPLVGAPGAPHPVGIVCEHPRDLLGKHVLFKSHSGVNIKTDQDDTEFGGKHALLVLTDRDILAVGEGL